MTAKDYVLIARVLRRVSNEFARQRTPDELSVVMRVLAKQLKDDNPMFDEDRFLTACGFYTRG